MKYNRTTTNQPSAEAVELCNDWHRYTFGDVVRKQFMVEKIQEALDAAEARGFERAREMAATKSVHHYDRKECARAIRAMQPEPNALP